MSPIFKEVDDLIVATSFLSKDPEDINNLYPISTAQNTDIDTWENLEETSYVRGIELDWQTHFWYLPSFLKGLVLNINYTHITSETSYPFQTSIRSGGFPPRITFVDSSRAGRMPDQPNDILNLTLGYDIGGFSGRISVFHQAEYNEALIASGHSYTINKAFTRLDLALKQRITDNFSLFLNVNNLTNVEEGNFNYSGNYDIRRFNQSEKYGTTLGFGIIGLIAGILIFVAGIIGLL